MTKKTITPELDTMKSSALAAGIVEALGDFPLEESKNVINGLFVAMLSIAKDLAQYQTEPQMVEKMLLGWMISTEQASGLNFHDFINLPEDKQ